MNTFTTVQRSPEAQPRPVQPLLLQRACACGGTPGPDGECAACKAKRLGIQRQATAAGPAAVPPIVHEVLSAPGQPLDAATRAYMEPRFGHDFSHVRVHTDARAGESARAVNALAYTVGRDIVFQPSNYAPFITKGQYLLAHELVHTLQQSDRLASDNVLKVAAPNDAAEMEADSIVTSVTHISPDQVSFKATSNALQRKTDHTGVSWELKDAPAAPTPDLRVALWLKLHHKAIENEESYFRVNRLAIAGAIAWEALENAHKLQSIAASLGASRAVGAGKPHLWDYKFVRLTDDTAAKQVEEDGYLPRRTFSERRDRLRNPEGAIERIAAIMALSADIAAPLEDLRCKPAMLADIYQTWSPKVWRMHVTQKMHSPAAASQPLMPANPMGIWVQSHLNYLRDAVGVPRCESANPVTDTMQSTATQSTSQLIDTRATRSQAGTHIRAPGITRWEGTAEQEAFLEQVLAAHIARSGKRKGSALPDLDISELSVVPGTEKVMSHTAALAAGNLLAAANQALIGARSAGDPDAARTVRISASSGYRSSTDQRDLWREYFIRSSNGYYNDTFAVRQQLPGGPHGPASVNYMVRYVSPKIAAPGFSNHQAGLAIDFYQHRAKGQEIANSTRDPKVALWQTTWFYNWLLRNAARFGFQEYHREPWHWTYQGEQQ